MKKLISTFALSATLTTHAIAMPTFHGTAPSPQYIYVHHNNFDKTTYMIGGAMLGITVGVIIWAITDKYVDPTHITYKF